MNKTTRNAIIIVFLIVFLDQLIKLVIKTHMIEGEEILVAGRWFRLHFIENSGMAFSMELPSQYGKLLLSLFRLVAIGFIIYMLRSLIKEKYHPGLIYSGAMILAGAIGNMVDSAFYGMIFTDSVGRVAEVFPKGGGYAGFLRGNVVDMLWFPIVHGVFPDWFPIWKGEFYEFLRPIFNIADAAITIGVAIIIIFHRTFFQHPVAEGETGEYVTAGVSTPDVTGPDAEGHISAATE